MNATPAWEKNHRNAMIFAGAMINGVVIFAAVAWFIRSSSTPETAPPSTLLYAWYALMAGGLIAAFVFRSKTMESLDDPAAAERIRNGTLKSEAIVNQTIISFAFIESAALLGVVIFFLGGPVTALYGALAYLALGAVLFFPRREHFERFREAER